MPRDRLLVIALAVVAASVFITPATRELFVGDETKYAQVVREMRAGAFFLPTLEGAPFTHKPPLHFWMIDGLTYLFGVYSTWSFVLPSILGFLLLLWLMWRMEGAIAAFVCGTSLMIWGSAQAARMDVTFTVAIVIAAWMLQRRSLVLAGVWLGIATLIKGPMAPVIGIFLFLFEWLRQRRGTEEPRNRGTEYGLAVVAMIGIPLLWFVPAMILGGDNYTREVLVKQTAGRAVGAWVHRSPFWYYIAHSPADLFPWFLLCVVAIIAAYKRADERAKFYVSWMLAVLVPYSALSSKLDVYMMALIPPAALLIARLIAVDDLWARRGHLMNVIMIVLLLLIGAAAPFVRIPAEYAAAKIVFVALAVASLAALALSLLRRDAVLSTLALGFVPLAAFLCGALFLMPFANEFASDRAMVRALVAQQVAPEEISLYTAPHVWTRQMPRELERVRYVSPETLRAHPTTLIVTSRRHASEIAGILRSYQRVSEFQLLGKPFDVYRR